MPNMPVGDQAQTLMCICAEWRHQSVERIAARKVCTIAEAVYRYNTTPKDAVTAASAPANAIHQY